jgi:hypothetical protein
LLLLIHHLAIDSKALPSRTPKMSDKACHIWSATKHSKNKWFTDSSSL